MNDSVPSLLLGLLIVVGTTVVAVVGLVVVRKLAPLENLKAHHEVGGVFIGIVGVIYAVLLAFVVFVVWQQYEAAQSVATLEASQLGDLWRLAPAFPPASEVQIRATLINYGKAVVALEWPAMGRGQESAEVTTDLGQVWAVYRTLSPETPVQVAVYQQSLTEVAALNDARRARLATSADAVPLPVWILLWAGAAVLIGFTYFFGVDSLVSQSLMTALMAVLIGFVLFLVFTLNHPFSGEIRVAPNVLQNQLALMEKGPSS